MTDSIVHIRSYTFEEFVDRVRSFHGFEAIGVIVGGFMVDLACGSLPEKGLFDVVCETPKCLPDAVQLLTPCTLGNGWVKVINLGRFALTLYDKKTGEGIRVFVDPAKIGAWPELEGLVLQAQDQEEQALDRLFDEARRAGAGMCAIQAVKVADWVRAVRHRGRFAVCPVCREAYPAADGETCLACQEEGPREAIERPPGRYFVVTGPAPR